MFIYYINGDKLRQDIIVFSTCSHELISNPLPSDRSILFYTFMVFDLCQTDSKVQHQNPNKKNHHSTDIAKSITTETPDRVYAKLGMPFQRDTILTFF